MGGISVKSPGLGRWGGGKGGGGRGAGSGSDSSSVGVFRLTGLARRFC